MPLYEICLTAETEGVVSIRPTKPRQWGLKVRCEACRDVSPHFIYVDETECCESSGGGSRNSIFKCSFCKGIISVSINPESYGTFTPEGGGVVLLIEVRGGVPEELQLDDQWVVKGEGSSFADVDLGGDWMEYDEGKGATMSITGVAVTFRRAKKAK